MNTLAVVTTVYNRPERLPETLAMLNAQNYEPFVVYLVNNNPTLREYVENVVSQWPLLDVRVQHNGRNMGSQAKNQSGHERAVEGFEHVVMLDDDINFGPDLLTQLHKQRRKDAIVGWNAWIFEGDYWNRRQAAIGEPADYVPSGCCIVPEAVLIDPRITRLNERYWAADDLWLSFVASHHHGLQLIRGNVQGVSIAVDHKDQYTRHIDMKREFLEELRAEGWLSVKSSANGGPEHRTRTSIDEGSDVVRGLSEASMRATVGDSIVAQSNGR